MSIGHREKGKRLPSLSEHLRTGSKRNKLFAGLDSAANPASRVVRSAKRPGKSLPPLHTPINLAITLLHHRALLLGHTPLLHWAVPASFVGVRACWLSVLPFPLRSVSFLATVAFVVL